MKNNSLSVILPIYNGMPFLIEAINSLQKQTFQDFVIYAIDNGSTDGTEEYLQQLHNKKIEYIKLEEINLVKALNVGLDLASTPFIARMDADDICSPTRFERQIEFLNKNKDIDLVGTFGQYIGEKQNRYFKINVPINHNGIVFAMLKRRYAIIHPSIMFRREIVEHNSMYNWDFFPCEDFELFLRIGDRINFANIPERLYSLRIRNESVMENQIKKSMEIYYRVGSMYARKFKGEVKTDKDTTFQRRSLKKLDILSLMIYRNGLNCYLNNSRLLGLFYFFISSLLNPFRLTNALKRRIFHFSIQT